MTVYPPREEYDEKKDAFQKQDMLVKSENFNSEIARELCFESIGYTVHLIINC